MAEKFVIDMRRHPAGGLFKLPDGADIRDVLVIADNRSTMIRLLDDPAWRESLKVAETPVEDVILSAHELYKKHYGLLFSPRS